MVRSLMCSQASGLKTVAKQIKLNLRLKFCKVFDKTQKFVQSL